MKSRSTRCVARRAPGWFLFVCVTLVLTPLWSSEMPHGPVTLLLSDALVGAHGENDAAQPRRVADLSLHTHLDEQGWAPVIGLAPDFNRSHHRGRIKRVRAVEGALHLEVELRVAGDSWVPGGAAAYHVVVPLPEADQWHDQPLAGSYTGRFDVHGVRGAARLTFTPALQPKADFTPLTDNTYPRLWFRSGDQRELRRRREQSPILAAAYQAMQEGDSVLSLAMMYHLSGDAAYAQRARVKVQARMDERGDGMNNTGLVWGERLRDVAYAYDLLAEHWDEAFRDSVRGYMDWIGHRLLHRPNTVSRSLNWAPNSVYQAYLRGAAAIASLVLHGGTGPEPQAPRPVSEQPRSIHSDPELSEHFREHDGQRLRMDTLPSRWWVAGPLPDPEESSADFLAHLDGSQSFHRRYSGDESIRFADAKASFSALDSKYFWDYHGRTNIELTDLYARHYQRKQDGFFHTAYFYTVLDVRDEELVRYADYAGGARVQAWINGQRLYADDYLRLHKGRHVLLLRAFIHSTSHWGKMWISPRFTVVSEADMLEDLRRRQADYELRYADYDEDRSYFDQHDGRNPAWRHLAVIAQVHMQQYYRHTFGRGGWALGGAPGVLLPLEYNTAFANIHGHGVTAVDDIETFAVRQLYQMIFAEQQNHFASLDGEQALQARHIARAWPRIPEAYQPAVLWLWDRLLWSSGEEIRFHDADEAVFTYLHYPVGLQSRHPHDVLPSYWYASDSGGVVLRNGFQGLEEDIVLQVVAREQGEGGGARPNAGAISVWAYGYEWAARPAQLVAHREHESVVHLPGLEHNRHMRGRVEQLRDDPFGGMLEINLDLIYAGTRARSDRHGRQRHHSLVDNLMRLRPQHIEDIGMRGGRSVAVDFSGHSGAPAVWVLVDRIEGGRNQSKRWHWNLPSSVETADSEMLDVQDAGFQLRQGDGVMQASLLRPQRLRLEAVLQQSQDIPGRQRSATVHGIQARGRRGSEGTFIAVFTLGKDQPPEVRELESEDQTMLIQVGPQRIRIDGMDIHFLEQEDP